MAICAMKQSSALVMVKQVPKLAYIVPPMDNSYLEVKHTFLQFPMCSSPRTVRSGSCPPTQHRNEDSSFSMQGKQVDPVQNQSDVCDEEEEVRANQLYGAREACVTTKALQFDDDESVLDGTFEPHEQDRTDGRFSQDEIEVVNLFCKRHGEEEDQGGPSDERSSNFCVKQERHAVVSVPCKLEEDGSTRTQVERDTVANAVGQGDEQCSTPPVHGKAPENSVGRANLDISLRSALTGKRAAQLERESLSCWQPWCGLDSAAKGSWYDASVDAMPCGSSRDVGELKMRPLWQLEAEFQKNKALESYAGESRMRPLKLLEEDFNNKARETDAGGAAKEPSAVNDVGNVSRAQPSDSSSQTGRRDWTGRKATTASRGEENVTKKTAVLTLRGLPFKTGEEEFARFLTRVCDPNCLAADRPVRLLTDLQGWPSGYGEVFLAPGADAKRVRHAIHLRLFGGRYIEVIDKPRGAPRCRGDRCATAYSQRWGGEWPSAASSSAWGTDRQYGWAASSGHRGQFDSRTRSW